MLKRLVASLTMLLIFAMLLSLICLPLTYAQKPVRTKKTYAFCTVIPNPVGVGQPTLIWLGISDYLSITQDGWVGMTVTVTRPDGVTETLGPFRTDATGSTGATYTPTMAGTYYFQSHFPAQWYNWTTADVWYEASDSEKFALTVREEPAPIYPASPLPTEYWTRPIDAQNREWQVISGNWLYSSAINSYPYWNWAVDYNEDAPETGHILWTKPMVLGGLAGGALGDHAYHMGDAYEGFFLNSIIIDGKLFYNRFNNIGGYNVDNYVVAVDLHTGETLWQKPLTPPNSSRVDLSFGWVMYWDSFNVHGAFAYLVAVSGSTWYMFEPIDGRWLFTMTNVPSGENIYGPNGEIIRYQVNLAQGWVAMWNSTAVIDCYWGTDPNSPNWGSWRPQGKTINATGPVRVTPATPLGLNGYQWNKTITKGLPGAVLAYLEDRILGGTDDAWSTHLAILRGDYSQTFWAISLKHGEEGRLLFNVTWTPTPIDVGTAFIGASAKEGIFLVAMKATRQLVAFSLDTGRQVWGPTEPQLPVDVFTIANWRRGATSIIDGKVISGGMGGRVHCYDAKTGKLLWFYDLEDPYNEILWGQNWPVYLSFVTDGKVYLHHAEHSPVDPMPRGAPYVCLDLETGEEIWKMNIRGVHWGGYPIIGDSIIAMFNPYDNSIYAIGKGPSAITVSASPEVSIHGSKVLVKGMVTDVSPGTDTVELRKRFPQGVPAVADESMSDWMEY
ncbi:MAG: PQQ-binding-like beta-propeller repeat protein, partial [Candidatus Bathyarchaeia archaeon]